HARLVGVAGATLQQALRFLAAVPSEVLLEQIYHCPQVPPFLDIDLEQVPHVVERRCSPAEMALLLDRGGRTVTLNDNQTAEHGTIFARHVLPNLVSLVPSERDLTIALTRGEENAPSIFRHPHVVEPCPPFGIDTHGRAQVNVRLLEAFRPHGHPPVEVS